ncbi:MAG: response regulator [Bacteroidetes bacterium]|jgi:two-component SAPR family response regulator|nr:response regulator [Bacteroidota bacterium]
MNKKVLIIEDDLILALSLEMMLKRIGFKEIQKVETGEEALEITESFCPDILLVDIQLGAGITGIETVKRIQSTMNVPALYITGNSDNFYKAQAEDTTFVDYLIKPITYRELNDVLVSHQMLEVSNQ